MMKRRGGGVQPSSVNSSHSNRQYESNLFSNERIRTILLTSSIWVIILSISLFAAIQYSSSKTCPENNLIKSNLKHFFF
jgi:hypothetical protein